MTKISILIALLLYLICTKTIVLVQGVSHCYEYFTYASKVGTTDILGQIKIPPPPVNDEYYLKVSLSTCTELPKQSIRLELVNSIKASVQAVRWERPLLYYIRFPPYTAIPTVSAIWFNNQKLCPGPEESGSIRTTIELGHIVYPPNEESLAWRNSRPWHRNSTSYRINNPSHDRIDNSSHDRIDNLSLDHIDNSSFGHIDNSSYNHLDNSTYDHIDNSTYNHIDNPNYNHINNSSHDNINNSSHDLDGSSLDNYSNDSRPTILDEIANECGITSYYINDRNSTISNGEKSFPGQWPWLVTLYYSKTHQDFFCAGNILTTRHVIAAAHCFMTDLFNKNTIDPTFLMVFGQFNSPLIKKGTITREVKNYTIHPDYAHTISADSDLAILVMKSPVEFNPFVRPLCLWSGSTEHSNIINKMGNVIGWSEDNSSNLNTAEGPRIVKVTIEEPEVCIRNHLAFFSMISNRTLCVVKVNEDSSCNADSGLAIFNSTTGRYQLRGIVSRSVRTGTGTCNTRKFVVYVDVAQYIPWIEQQISIT